MSTLADTNVTPVSIEEAEDASASLGDQVGRARAVLEEFRTVMTTPPPEAVRPQD